MYVYIQYEHVAVSLSGAGALMRSHAKGVRRAMYLECRRWGLLKHQRTRATGGIGYLVSLASLAPSFVSDYRYEAPAYCRGTFAKLTQRHRFRRRGG